MPRFSVAPEKASATEYHNYVVVQRDSLAMGVVNASVPFLPVFVARLGGSDVEVGLLSALPALAGLLFAIPAAVYLRRQRRVVPVYSRARLIASLGYVATAIATVVVPGPWVVPAILAIWAVASVPSTIGMVAFAVVMDGAAGPRGRFDLLSRRWSIMGLTTAISVVIIGQLLDVIGFPVNYQLVFAAFSVAGLASFHFSRKIRLQEEEPPPQATGPVGERFRATLAGVTREPRFVGFVVRHLVYATGLRFVAPLIPLYYVREVRFSDGWIGLIATAQSFALLAGYIVWRRQSRVRGPRFVLLAATAVAAAYPGTLAFARVEPVVIVVVALGSLFAAGTDLALFDELMRTIPKGQGLTFAAIDQSAMNAAGIAAPLLGTLLAGVIGIPNALVVGSALSLAGFVLFALDRPRLSARRPAPSADRPG